MFLPTDIYPFLNKGIELSEKRPNILQVHAPFFHEDGDMYDIFIEPGKEPNKIKVSDYGMTLMRLSYTYDTSTITRLKILNRIIYSNDLELSNGIIFIEVDVEQLYSAIMMFSQVISKITNMKNFQRDTIHNLFFEDLEDFVYQDLRPYHPDKNFHPIPSNPEYEVDYCFNHRERPLYLFAINNPSNAKLATISCLKFEMEKIKFKGVMVIEKLAVIPKKDLNRLLSVSYKNFPSLEDFKENAQNFFERESMT